MRIIHTADWHLGQTFYSFERASEHRVFLDWMASILKERDTDLLLIAGDVFDSPNPSAESQRMFYSFLTRVTTENPSLKVIITAGNHDSAARLEAPNPLLHSFNTNVSGIVHYKNNEIDYERMIIPVDEITVRRQKYRIQAYAFTQYRILHILIIHFLDPSLASFVAAPLQILPVMLEGISLRHPEEILRHRLSYK
jgi:exonuclease SbcD